MKGEFEVMDTVRMDADSHDTILFRNNVGAMLDKNGRQVRFGLANESAKHNKKMKSSDLIGIRRVTITPDMVGQTVGVFVARECKREGWQFDPTNEHELAQKKFIDLVTEYGGDASFATGEGSFDDGSQPGEKTANRMAGEFRKNDIIARGIAYIRTLQGKPVTRKELAEALGMSVVGMTHNFEKKTSVLFEALRNEAERMGEPLICKSINMWFLANANRIEFGKRFKK